MKMGILSMSKGLESKHITQTNSRKPSKEAVQNKGQDIKGM